MQKLSALIPCYNSAKIIRAALESVKWADEILVVDSFSADETLAICREYTDRIVRHEYVNSARQKNWAIPQCRYDWVLILDTDETLEPELAEEIRKILEEGDAAIDGYNIPRKNFMCGKWVRHGGVYPDYQLRLFRRDKGRYSDREVHAHVQVPGRIGILKHHILHEGTPNLSKQLRNLDRYTRYEADEMRKRGKRFRWHHLLARPPLIFAYRYLWLQGFRDGWRGFILAAYVALYDFMAHVKLWEMEELKLHKSP